MLQVDNLPVAGSEFRFMDAVAPPADINVNHFNYKASPFLAMAGTDEFGTNSMQADH
jgi:hypothetical protein